MATIIKKGDKTYTCPTCGCEYTIDSSDIKIGTEKDGTFTSWVCCGVPCKYVNCPQCGKKKVIEWL